MAILQARNTVEITASLTRPANITPYDAGDVIDATVAAGLTFPLAVRGNGLGGIIRDAKLFDSANVTPAPDIELWLFSAAVAAFDADNTPFTPTDADFFDTAEGISDGIVGVIPFQTGDAFVGDATAGAGGNLLIPATKTSLPIEFVTAGNSRSLFGILVVRNAYIPVSAESFRVFLEIDQS